MANVVILFGGLLNEIEKCLTQQNCIKAVMRNFCTFKVTLICQFLLWSFMEINNKGINRQNSFYHVIAFQVI